MNIQKYINSGALEDYCMGLLNERDSTFLIRMANFYPEVKAELTALELTFEILAISQAVEPAAHNREKLMAAFGFDKITDPDFDNLPPLSKDADYRLWLDVFKNLLPDLPREDVAIHDIRKNGQLQQMLVVAKKDIPDEVHGEMLESFYILEGQCLCIVGDELYHLHAGDFMQIPLHAKHNIKVLSPYVAAVLQYEFV